MNTRGDGCYRSDPTADPVLALDVMSTANRWTIFFRERIFAVSDNAREHWEGGRLKRVYRWEISHAEIAFEGDHWCCAQ